MARNFYFSESSVGVSPLRNAFLSRLLLVIIVLKPTGKEIKLNYHKFPLTPLNTLFHQLLLIPDVLSSGLNFVSLHGLLVSLRGLKKKNDRVITSLSTARTNIC